jgi:hypothetical protein
VCEKDQAQGTTKNQQAKRLERTKKFHEDPCGIRKILGQRTAF